MMNLNITVALTGFIILLAGRASAQFSSEGVEALRRINARQTIASTATYRHVNTLSPRLILRGEDRQAELDRAVAASLAKYKASLAQSSVITDSNARYSGFSDSDYGFSRCFGSRYVVPRVYYFGGLGGKIIVSPQINCFPGRPPYRYYGVKAGPCDSSVVIIKKK